MSIAHTTNTKTSRAAVELEKFLSETMSPGEVLDREDAMSLADTIARHHLGMKIGSGSMILDLVIAGGTVVPLIPEGKIVPQSFEFVGENQGPTICAIKELEMDQLLAIQESVTNELRRRFVA